MKRTNRVILGCLLLAGLAGCVSREKYNTLLATNEKQKEKIANLRQQVRELELTAERLRTEIKDEEKEVAALRRTEAARDQQISLLKQRTRALEEKIKALAQVPPPPVIPAEAPKPAESEPPAVVLPAEVVKAVEDLATKEPILEFDPRTGCCRFTGKVLFAKGSDKVQPEFAAVLRKFAAIFTTGPGKGLHLRIEGHTDNQPIRNVGTRALHPTNWHLAAHRAIEVLRVLYKAGIDQDRVEVVSYGSQRPIADNKTPEGRARNRRVEIFIVPPNASRP